MRAAYRVFYTEYERGWGSRPDGHKDFTGDNALTEATEHVRVFNAQNNLPVAPDWYMVASVPTLVDLDNDK
jgi:hypothetical protein